jgi:crotonobetainyl-CoA:carnitine CoA-transferase CaiB-like acyl-CoA transferase
VSEPRGPLDGVRVVACSIAQAGTVCYMLMADMGAEVIKIELPGEGDSSRGQAGQIPGFPSSYFETNNRGVKSFTLNLKAPEAKEILYKMVKDADIFGQNHRPGALDKMGFGYEDLKKVNPRIVYVSVSGYGPKGPHANLPGTDSMAQALGGITEAYSSPGQLLKTGVVAVADETCAILTYGAILTGLYCARMTGVGQKIETSLLGGQIRLMGHVFNTAMWKNEGPITGQARIGGTYERPSLTSTFNDKNGKPFCVQGLSREWKDLMTKLGF